MTTCPHTTMILVGPTSSLGVVAYACPGCGDVVLESVSLGVWFALASIHALCRNITTTLQEP